MTHTNTAGTADAIAEASDSGAASERQPNPGAYGRDLEVVGVGVEHGSPPSKLARRLASLDWTAFCSGEFLERYGIESPPSASC